MSGSARKRVAVLISGRGSNMNALIAAAADPRFPGEIVAVVSNRPDAAGLATARRYGVHAAAVDHRAYPGRAEHEAAVVEALEAVRPDVVCLAGYMRLLTSGFVARYRGRMINIHPSLLPLFPGLHTHRRALAAGVRIHGCTVHFVTEATDEGPIIAQAAIAVETADTPDNLAARLLDAEHRLYPHGLRMLLDGTVRMEGDRAVFRQDASPDPRIASPASRAGVGDVLVSPDDRQR